MRALLYFAALVLPFITGQLCILNYLVFGGTLRNNSLIVAFVTGLLAAGLGLSWLNDLRRGSTFWIPIRWHALVIVVLVAIPPLYLLIFADKLAAGLFSDFMWADVPGQEIRVVPVIVSTVAAILIVISFGADCFSIRPWLDNIRFVSVPAYIAGSIGTYLMWAYFGPLSVFVSLGVLIGYFTSKSWWGKRHSPDDLVHASLDFWFGRIGILSEGTKKLVAVGLHGLSRAREKKLDLE